MTLLLRSLLYHRIGDPSGADPYLSPDLISATPAEFERQIAWIARLYTPVSASQVVAAVERRRPLPTDAILVTIDDGYRDFAEIAWPILRTWQVPAVLFVPTAFPDTTSRMFWWDEVWQAFSRTDRLSVQIDSVGDLSLATLEDRRNASARVSGWLKTLGPEARTARIGAILAELGVRSEWVSCVSGWADLRKLAHDGVTIAGHSRTHALLDQIDDRALDDEIVGCRSDLVRELGTSPPLFAYPNGNFDLRMPAVLARGGFAAAVTTVPGLNHLGRSHPSYLRREDGRAALWKLLFKLREPVGMYRAWRRPLPR